MTQAAGAVLRALAVGIVLALGLATSAVAQSGAPPSAQVPAAPQEIDYAAWEAEAARVEALLEAGTASTAFFQNVRAGLTERRALFQAAASRDAGRVATLEAQIGALGPVPAEDQTEPEEIARQRAALNEELARVRVPQIQAASALTRADGLIGEIDTLLRERQQEQLLRLDPSPLNPANWAEALSAVRAIVATVAAQTANRIGDPVRREAFVDNAPGTLALMFVGILAILRGRLWTTRLTERLQARATTRGRISVAFLVSLLQLAVPFFGVALILSGILSTGMLGAQGRVLVEAMGAFALSIYVALWLAGRLFREHTDTAFAPLAADRGKARAAKWVVTTIGVGVGLGIVARAITDLDQVSPAAYGVLHLPGMALLSYLFWRLSRLLRGEARAAAEAGVGGFLERVVTLACNLLIAIAVIGPVLALVGYVNFAESLMIPTALSVLLIGIFLAIQPVVRDLYAVLFRRTHEEASAALIPVLVDFLLVFAAVPIFVLIWGARPEAIADIYTRFWEGVSLGEARITPESIIAVVLVFAIGFIVTRLLQGALKSTVLPRTRLDPGAQTAVAAGVGYVGIALAAVIAITAGGIDLTALGVLVGALSVGIGFGLQNVVNNFVSGIILLIERPISEGDWIEVNGTMGIVKDISVRSTRVETFDRTDVIVPNADFISGTVTNWTRGNTIGRAVVTVGVAYGTDTRRVQRILMEIAREHPAVAAFPEPGVDFLGFGASSLDFRIRAILRDVNQLLAVQTEIHHRIAERFAEEGIEIPFAQRDVWLRNPEALRPAEPQSDAHVTPEIPPVPSGATTQ
jgi:small-conductance mechanosensitive channel